MSSSKKERYAARLTELLSTHTSGFLVDADNVGSKQFQSIRAAIRPGSTIAMGKNTQMKRTLREYCDANPGSPWEGLADHLVLNVGVVFTKDPLNDVKAEIEKWTVGAPARTGVVAPVDVTVPAGSTGMDPSQTQFFQALNIATKIVKGAVEIINDVTVCVKDTKVTSSQATLLAKLNVLPFLYSLDILKVFDNGSVYDAKVLDMTDDDMEAMVLAGISNIASISLELGYATIAAVPHALITGFKNAVAVCLETEYSFEKADAIKAKCGL